MRAFQALLPIPFLAAGGLLFMTGPLSQDVVVQSTDYYPTTTRHEYPTTTHVGSTTTTEESTTVPTTSTIPSTTTTIDQCPPEDEPCTPGQQTTIPATTTTLPSTTTTESSATSIARTTTTLSGTTTSSTSTSTLPGTTTTLVGTSTSVAPIDSFDIGGASSVCSRDVPFIDITFGNEPQFNGLVGTITFSTLDGDFIEEIPVTYQANTTVRLVFPGASFDPVTGEATDWPGWVLNADGFWVTDPTDAEFRDGIVITASLPAPVGGLGQSLSFLEQVSASTTVTYPPETAACNSPTGPFPPGGPTNIRSGSTGSLPVTGPQALGLMLLAIGIATGLGNAFVQIGRKNGN